MSDLPPKSTLPPTPSSPPPPPPPPLPPFSMVASPIVTCSQGEDPTAKKRFYVIQEILSTELTYVTRLKLTIDVVYGQMKAQNILDKKDLSLQFDGLDQIYQLHARHSLDGTTSQNLKFLSLFEDIASNCDIYSQYLANYEPAMQRRGALLTKNRRYSDFVSTLEKDPILQGATLESLLILPVQRIPRYRLLMEQLIKYTPETHPDFSILQNALATISLTAQYNNEAIRARENKEKILQIMLLIEPTTRVDLLEDINRRFVMEATLLRQCRKRYKEFQFWLFTDQLCYGEKTPLGLYTLNRQIFLNKCYIQQDLPDSEIDFREAFIVMSPAKTFKVRAKSAQEKIDWVSAINTLINNNSSDANKGNNNIAPLWKPDHHSLDCELCHTPFTLLFRRHHCRHCGRVVCDPCSAKRFMLHHVDSRRPVRVCDLCFPLLSTNNPGNNSSVSTSNNNHNNNSNSSKKRTGMLIPQTSGRTELGSDDESDDDDELFHHHHHADDENNESDGERSRGEVDETALDDFNDWEQEQRQAGTLPSQPRPSDTLDGTNNNINNIKNNSIRSENERIATLVTAPMMKMSAALGENIRRFARSSLTAFSPPAASYIHTYNNSDQGRAVSPLPGSPSPSPQHATHPPLGATTPTSTPSATALKGAVKLPVFHNDNPIFNNNNQQQPFQSHSTNSANTGDSETASSPIVKPPRPGGAPPPPPPPPPRRLSTTSNTPLSQSPSTLSPGDATTSHTTTLHTTTSDTSSSSSTAPVKPQRAQRRTNVVLHIDPALIAAEAARHSNNNNNHGNT